MDQLAEEQELNSDYNDEMVDPNDINIIDGGGIGSEQEEMDDSEDERLLQRQTDNMAAPNQYGHV